MLCYVLCITRKSLVNHSKFYFIAANSVSQIYHKIWRVKTLIPVNCSIQVKCNNVAKNGPNNSVMRKVRRINCSGAYTLTQNVDVNASIFC